MEHTHTKGNAESQSINDRRTRRSARTRSSVRDVWVGIDFGTSSIRAAFTDSGRPPEQIPMGETHDVSGGLVTSYRFPTAVWFKGPTEFELLGHHKASDFNNIASGVKQSLDANLCQQGGQGERFMALCEKYKVDKTAIVCALFKTTLNYITACLDATNRGNMARVNITVPVVWSIDKHGQKIQEEMEKIAIRAGFPEDKISFDTEPGSALAYLAEKYGSWKRRRRVRTNEPDPTPLARFTGLSWKLIASIGISDRCRRLQKVCFEATGDADAAAVLFQAARDHVHEMGEVSEPFVLGQHRISAETFDHIIQACYERALRMARKEFHRIDDVDVVMICGSATASNAHIKSLWLRHVEQWRLERQTTTGKAKLAVDVLQPEDAVKAVSTGSSIPYGVEPTDEFRKRCFGILCVDADEAPEGEMIIEMKSPYSDEVESGWEKVNVHTRPDDFTVEPHMIHGGKPLGKPFISEDTGRRIWPAGYAMPMNPIVLDLSGLAKTGDEVLVRFVRPRPTELTLEVSHAAPGGAWLGKVDLKLGMDRDRLFLTEIGHQYANR